MGRRLSAKFQLCGSKGVAAYDGHPHTHASRHVYYIDKSDSTSPDDGEVDGGGKEEDGPEGAVDELDEEPGDLVEPLAEVDLKQPDIWAKSL